MNNAFQNYLEIKDNCLSLASDSKGLSTEFQVLPVTKGHSVDKIKEFILASKQREFEFGENYFEELSEKASFFLNDDKNIKIKWHFLGRLQSRKIRELMSIASVFHGVSREKELLTIAAELKKSQSLTFESFFVQVNISSEITKGGLALSEVEFFLKKIVSLGLEKYFRGFMAMASPLGKVGESQVRKEFLELKNLRDKFRPHSKLNIGMTDDYKLAIECGSQLIRIGTKIFGSRN
jgi:pyridoxal phosphate enzyme (YggS family)